MAQPAISSWLGAVPVVENGFAFANGEFFAEASGQNRHRRATLDELKAHVDSGSDKNHTAHWFEAQLIHYGLPSSKVKSVARMRLYDAVKADTIAVPTHIVKLEAKLRKEWTRQDNKIKRAGKSSNEEVLAQGTFTSDVAKKPSRAANSRANGKKVTSTSDSTPDAARKRRKERIAKTSGIGTTTIALSTQASRISQKARRSGLTQGPDRVMKSESLPLNRQPRQTVRRSAPFIRGRLTATNA